MGGGPPSFDLRVYLLATVALSDGARRAVERSHRALEHIVRKGEPAYGITTGVGELERVVSDLEAERKARVAGAPKVTRGEAP